MAENKRLLTHEEIWNTGTPCTEDKDCPFNIANSPCSEENDDKCTICEMIVIAEAQDKKTRQAVAEEIKGGLENFLEDVTALGSVEQILAFPKYKWHSFWKKYEVE